MTDSVENLIQPDELIRNLQSLRNAGCRKCAAGLCSHQVLINIALGFKNEPQCIRCLASGLEKSVTELRDHVWDHIRRRDCYFTGWQWANISEGFAVADLPACLWSAPAESSIPAPVPNPDHIPRQADLAWNAGDLGCGDLVLELRLRLMAMQPGQVLKVTAQDPGAPADIPAWCKLTGHILRQQLHPEYFIQRKP